MSKQKKNKVLLIDNTFFLVANQFFFFLVSKCQRQEVVILSKLNTSLTFLVKIQNVTYTFICHVLFAVVITVRY